MTLFVISLALGFGFGGSEEELSSLLEFEGEVLIHPITIFSSSPLFSLELVLFLSKWLIFFSELYEKDSFTLLLFFILSIETIMSGYFGELDYLGFFTSVVSSISITS